MSIVIYSDGVLGADRRCVIAGGAWNVHQTSMQKLHIHESKTFAVASAGHLPGPRGLKVIMDTVQGMLLKFFLEDSQESMELTKELKDRLFSESRTSMIVMTKTDVWFFHADQPTWIEITHHPYYSGNGSPAASVCIAAGLSVQQALEEVPHVSTECGDGHDLVKFSMLKAMKVEK